MGDLLGVRLICLRLSDLRKVEAYLELLVEEKILRFIRKPDYKRSFVLPADPGEPIPVDLDPRYKGKRQRDVEAINAVNFALSYEIHGGRVAQEGLRSVLRWRKKRSLL